MIIWIRLNRYKVLKKAFNFCCKIKGDMVLEFISSKLPTVPEENGTENIYREQTANWCYADLDLNNMQVSFLN